LIFSGGRQGGLVIGVRQRHVVLRNEFQLLVVAAAPAFVGLAVGAEGDDHAVEVRAQAFLLVGHELEEHVACGGADDMVPGHGNSAIKRQRRTAAAGRY